MTVGQQYATLINCLERQPFYSRAPAGSSKNRHLAWLWTGGYPFTPAGFRRRLASMTQPGFIQKRCNSFGRAAITLIPRKSEQFVQLVATTQGAKVTPQK
jgi:hypothetical protein